MPATLTLTGTAGAGITVSAVVFTGVGSFTIDTVLNMVTFLDNTGQLKTISIAAATTITATKSGSNYTLVIS